MGEQKLTRGSIGFSLLATRVSRIIAPLQFSFALSNGLNRDEGRRPPTPDSMRRPVIVPILSQYKHMKLYRKYRWCLELCAVVTIVDQQMLCTGEARRGPAFVGATSVRLWRQL